MKREVEDFSKMTGPLAAQEYLQELVRNDPNDIARIVEVPRECDAALWQYEHVRELLIEINILIALLAGKCTPASCPVLTVQNESYRCTTHGELRDCSAYDYMLHNVDTSVEFVLNRRRAVGRSRDGREPDILADLHQIVRRLYRVLAHAMLYHAQVFEEFERQTALYQRLVALMTRFHISDPKSLLSYKP